MSLGDCLIRETGGLSTGSFDSDGLVSSEHFASFRPAVVSANSAAFVSAFFFFFFLLLFLSEKCGISLFLDEDDFFLDFDLLEMTIRDGLTPPSVGAFADLASIKIFITCDGFRFL